jgi:uncharacterized membrane protein YcaP (DUF421 family)
MTARGCGEPNVVRLMDSMWKFDANTTHWYDFVVRATIVYIFLLVLLRLTGKRQVGQLAPFDLVLLLVLSNAVQNAMNAGDNSVTAGLILATTLIVLNWIVAWLTYSNKKFEALIEGRPMILIHNGKFDQTAMRHTKMTKHELETSLRAEGCAGPEEVLFAILENNGKVTVIPRRAREREEGTPK